MRGRGLTATEAVIVAIFVLLAGVGALIRSEHAGGGAPTVVSAPPAVVTSLSGLSRQPPEPLFAFDSVSVNGKPVPVASVRQVDVRKTDTVAVNGWAADHAAGQPAAAVFLSVGTAAPIRLSYGSARPDVAASLGNPNLRATGFSGVIPRRDLTSGVSPLTFFVVDHAGTSYSDITATVSFVVR